MAYARRYRRNTRRPTRRPHRRRARSMAPKVTVRKRVTLAKKSTVMRNKRAIRSLAMRMYGSLQCSLVRNDQVLTVDDLHPLLFDLTDATQKTIAPPQLGAGVYQLDSSLTPPAIAIVSNFETPSNVASNPFVARWAADRPGTGKYLLKSTTCCISIEGRPSVTNTRVRIQVFRSKAWPLVSAPPIVPPTPDQDQRLPDALIHLNHMCDVTAKPNLLPRKYFTTLIDKWVVLNSAPANVVGVGRHPTTLNKKYYRFKIRKPQVIKQAITFPSIQGPDTPTTPVSEPDGGFYGPFNRSYGSHLWVMVSSDDQANALHPGSVSIGISKYHEYRDPVGAY